MLNQSINWETQGGQVSDWRPPFDLSLYKTANLCYGHTCNTHTHTELSDHDPTITVPVARRCEHASVYL